jgi:hypothetical protein
MLTARTTGDSSIGLVVNSSELVSPWLARAPSGRLGLAELNTATKGCRGRESNPHGLSALGFQGSKTTTCLLARCATWCGRSVLIRSAPPNISGFRHPVDLTAVNPRCECSLLYKAQCLRTRSLRPSPFPVRGCLRRPSFGKPYRMRDRRCRQGGNRPRPGCSILRTKSAPSGCMCPDCRISRWWRAVRRVLTGAPDSLSRPFVTPLIPRTSRRTARCVNFLGILVGRLGIEPRAL